MSEIQGPLYPDKLITIPEPLEDEKEGIDLSDLDDLVVEMNDFEDWQSVLDSFAYGEDTEITKVVIESVVGTQLFTKNGFSEITEAPATTTIDKFKEEVAIEQLIDNLKHSVRNIASSLLADEGIGSHELGYLYNVIMDHVSKKLLNGNSAGTAAKEQLLHALCHLNSLLSFFCKYKGLVSSIIKYKRG